MIHKLFLNRKYLFSQKLVRRKLLLISRVMINRISNVLRCVALMLFVMTGIDYHYAKKKKRAKT